ncbi:hypothetical protein KL86CLO1_12106 [uncultured Eubacteriales bacterium]|uniref:Uncharacterized protein n=1 Tax=uncultured Eubacteriales bacterium TaxID=172733 RepID=A0A212K2U3_9FIRM|nr:hypothetical protein KL86CLO1_12106 [uncultured Eubacteriales bacterium]
MKLLFRYAMLIVPDREKKINQAKGDVKNMIAKAVSE